MSKIIIICCRSWIFVIFSFFFLYSSASTQLIKISQRIFEQSATEDFGDTKEISHKMELGSMKFYFSEQPIINFVPTKQRPGGKRQAVFIFPRAKVDEKIFGTIVNNINKQKSRYYDICIERIKKPIEGIRLLITFDPNQVTFEYKFFESIKSEQGIIFSFYNRKLLNVLQSKEFYVLRTI